MRRVYTLIAWCVLIALVAFDASHDESVGVGRVGVVGVAGASADSRPAWLQDSDSSPLDDDYFASARHASRIFSAVGGGVEPEEDEDVEEDDPFVAAFASSPIDDSASRLAREMSEREFHLFASTTTGSSSTGAAAGACDNNPCQNSGVCTQGSTASNFTCACTSGWRSDHHTRSRCMHDAKKNHSPHYRQSSHHACSLSCVIFPLHPQRYLL